MVLAQKIRKEQDYTYFQSLFDLEFIKTDRPLQNVIKEEIQILKYQNYTNEQIYLTISYILSRCVMNDTHFIKAREFETSLNNLRNEGKLDNPISRSEFNEYIRTSLSKTTDNKKQDRLKILRITLRQNIPLQNLIDENISPENKKILDQVSTRLPSGLVIPAINVKPKEKTEKFSYSPETKKERVFYNPNLDLFRDIYKIPSYIDADTDTTLSYHTIPSPNIKPDMEFDNVYITVYAIPSENRTDPNYYRNYGFRRFRGSNDSAVGMNGTGKRKDGKYIKYNNAVHNKPNTASGTIPVPFRTLAVPSNIPYGSYIYIEGSEDPRFNGWYIAEDTGSAITYKRGRLRLDFFTGEDFKLYQTAVVNLQGNKNIKISVYKEFPYPESLPENEGIIAEEAKKRRHARPLYYATGEESKTKPPSQTQREVRSLPSTNVSEFTTTIPNTAQLFSGGFRDTNRAKINTEAYKYGGEWYSRVLIEYNGKWYDTLIPNPSYRSDVINPSGIAFFAFNSKEEWRKCIENNGGAFPQVANRKQ